MKFIIQGEPKAKKRHRISKGRTYDPQEKEKNYIKMDLIRQVALAAKSENKSILGQLNALCEASTFSITFEFHVKPPKSDLWGLNECVVKSDIDNYVKLILDSANGILFKDDHLVVEIHAKKCYSAIPRTIMDIEPMPAKDKLSKNQTQVLKNYSPDEMSAFLEDISQFGNISYDMSLASEEEYQNWIKVITQKQITFARKWGAKLKKLADKTKDETEDI